MYDASVKKILILTAGFGDGHNAAARNLRDAIELVDEDARAEVVDLFADSYGAFNTFARKTYLGMVQYAPKLWGGIYSLLENPFVEKQLGGFTRLQNHAGKNPGRTQPDCVVSTYPIYGHIIKKIYASHHERPFRFITVVTDSITVNSVVVPRAERFFLRGQRRDGGSFEKGGVAEEQIKVLGFPGQPGVRGKSKRICPHRSATNRAACFTSSTPARKRRARRLTACWKLTTCI